jgi:hypothetical protein
MFYAIRYFEFYLSYNPKQFYRYFFVDYGKFRYSRVRYGIKSAVLVGSIFTFPSLLIRIRKKSSAIRVTLVFNQR